MQTTINILEILKKELIGKKVKMSSYHKYLMIDAPIRKFINGVTNKVKENFDWNNINDVQRFTKLIPRAKKIGTHTIYSHYRIVDILYVCEIHEGDYIYLVLQPIEGGESIKYSLDISANLILIDKDTYMFEYK